MWVDMRRDLQVRDPNWRVWTDWQDARFAGEAPGADVIELARIASGEFWALGPTHANAEIARRVASPM
jgi:hypothetical protein